MKLITFASFKGGAGKTTAVMAVTSALSQKGKQVALIDADENMPLVEWRDTALKAGTWSDDVSVYGADDLRSFEQAFEDSASNGFNYAIIDTRGGGSELNNACLKIGQFKKLLQPWNERINQYCDEANYKK